MVPASDSVGTKPQMHKRASAQILTFTHASYTLADFTITLTLYNSQQALKTLF
jgi:hypothetical protein